MALLLNAGDTVSRSYSYTQPSPLHPSLPQGTGERTGNLFDEQLERGTLNENASPIGSTYQQCKDVSAHQRVRSINLIHTDGVATISFNNTKYNLFVLFFDNDALYTGRYDGWETGTFTVNSPYIGIVVKPISGNVSPDADDFNIMINSGSTALPYEPYGVKIPISSASTTTPVYLGEVESTRLIKKLVLTGDENFTLSYGSFRIIVPDYYRQSGWIPICTHYQGIDSVTGGGDLTNGQVAFLVSASANYYIYICDTNCATAADFKAYLAAQYAAGTPVTVWYVLANETTAVVNEPLMRIGNYADTLSNISIPVTAGGDTLSIGTTVQPSEVTVNYKGWHPVADVHERDNGAWT